MTHGKLVRSLLLDATVGALAAAVIVGVGLVAPFWVVGLVCLLLVPALIVCLVVNAALGKPISAVDRYCSAVDVELDESRRRDFSKSSPAVMDDGPVAAPFVSPLAHWRAPGFPASERPTPKEKP